MRKFMFLLFFGFAVIAFGHDLFIYSKNFDKGFQLTDLGSFWAKYHKDSHDHWKIILKDFSQIMDGVLHKEGVAPNSLDDKAENMRDYQTKFVQLDSQDADESVELEDQLHLESHDALAQRIIVRVLEQKAVFIFGTIAFFIYLLGALATSVFRKKDEMERIGYSKDKRSGYQFKRKK